MNGHKKNFQVSTFSHIHPLLRSTHSKFIPSNLYLTRHPACVGSHVSGQMRLKYDIPVEDYAATVVASACDAFSVEEAEEQNRRKMREYFELSRTNSVTIDIKPGSHSAEGANNRRSSNRDAPGDAEITKFPRRSSYAAGDNAGVSRRVAESEAKADAWEKAQMEKIRKQHDDMKSGILAWESEKKKEAKLLFDKRKQELDHKGQINERLYQNKVTKVDGIARKAMTRVEEKRGDEESRVKEKLKRIRSRKSRLMCFCC